MFAERGYAAVSTRALAQGAGVNLSAITYHFGGKRGLYRAVITQLIADTEPGRRGLIGMLETGVAAAAGDRRALARLAQDTTRRILRFLLNPDLPAWRLQLTLREVNQPGIAFDLVMERHLNPLHDAIAGLVAATTGASAADERTRLLAQAVVGICLSFGPVRSVVLARLGWDRYTSDRIVRVEAIVGEAVTGALGLAETGAALAAASVSGR